MASEAGTAQTVNPGSKADVCAVVVTYHPDPGFPDRLDRVRPQVGRVVVVDNGSSPPAREMLRNAAGPDVELILNDANLGVATALNQGVAARLGSVLPVGVDVGPGLHRRAVPRGSPARGVQRLSDRARRSPSSARTTTTKYGGKPWCPNPRRNLPAWSRRPSLPREA